MRLSTELPPVSLRDKRRLKIYDDSDYNKQGTAEVGAALGVQTD